MEGAEQPLRTPTSTPSGTNSRTCRSTTRNKRPRRSHWILPRSSASSAASPGSRSRCSSRRSGGPWIPKPRPSWRSGSATSASPGWGRSSLQSPREPAGSTGGRLGRIASCRRIGRSGPDGAGTGAVKPSVRLSGTPPREWPSRATFSETTSWTPSQPIWSAAGQRCVAGPSPVRRDTSDDYYDDLPVSPPVVRCLAVDLVAVERDGVVWLDPPRLKARVANQRLGQGVRSGDQGAAQVDLGSNAPGLVLGPEQVG